MNVMILKDDNVSIDKYKNLGYEIINVVENNYNNHPDKFEFLIEMLGKKSNLCIVVSQFKVWYLHKIECRCITETSDYYNIQEEIKIIEELKRNPESYGKYIFYTIKSKSTTKQIITDKIYFDDKLNMVTDKNLKSWLDEYGLHIYIGSLEQKLENGFVVLYYNLIIRENKEKL